jgi:hypothetical protein
MSTPNFNLAADAFANAMAVAVGVVVGVVCTSKSKVQKDKGLRGPVVFRTRFG